ncbi:MAG: hypothetical protein U0354_15415 [Candidatus Sericytochromatia bacterium]
MSITLLLGYLLATTAVAATLYIAFLAFKDLISKIRTKSETMNENEVGYILKNEMENGNVKVMYGILNMKTNQTRESEAIIAEKIDRELQQQGNLTILN